MAEFVFALEILGTIAFAISGAVVALRKNMDIFGVCIMGVICACGGGVLRDLFLGQLPPMMFIKPVFACASILVSLILFFHGMQNSGSHWSQLYEIVLLIADSAGLGMFTVAGISSAMHAGYGESFFFAVFLGVLTGVGGGVLRDVLAGVPLYIFTKHVYACAAIVGAVLCRFLWPFAGERFSMMLSALVIFIIRLLAAHFRWSLPRARITEGVSDTAKR